mgnify:CR=1 FL=1
MKFAHKHTGVKGGTQIVTVTEYNGKGLVKTTIIPTEMSKQLNIPFKTLVYLVESSHEKYLKDAVTKLEKTK